VWSPRHGEYVTDERARNLELRFVVNVDTAMKFVAKVALSAGYFVYGNLKDPITCMLNTHFFEKLRIRKKKI
jgi:hypothetical protein